MRFSLLAVIALLLVATPPLRAQTAPSPADKKAVDAKLNDAMIKSAPSTDSLALPAPRKANPKISSRFDRFRQRTVVTATPVKSGLFNMNLMTIDVYFAYPGKAMSAPPQYVLVSVRPEGGSSRWELLKDHSMLFLADDSVSVDAGETYHEGEVDDAGRSVSVREQVTAVLPIRDYLRLAAAQKLEMRVGGEQSIYQHTFKPQEMETIRDLASLLNPVATP